MVKPTLMGEPHQAAFSDRDGKPLNAGGNLPLARCPHCGTANPLMTLRTEHNSAIGKQGERSWKVFECSYCGGCVLVLHAKQGTEVVDMFPRSRLIDSAVPERAGEYLRQASESFAQPSGSIVCSASAVDALLKKRGLKEGSLYARIDEAATSHLVTADMAEWAHSVRLDANEQRHADEDAPLPTLEDAKRCYDFAVALAEIMFVLPSRVARGIEKAKSP